MALVLTGEWLGIEKRSGTTKDDDGTERKWGFVQASVLDGLEVRKLRVGDDYLGAMPGPRQPCQMLIEVRAYNRRNGAAESGWTLLEWLDDPNGVNGKPKG